MSFNYSPKIVTDGLVLYLDAANRNSYPGTGSVWTDLSRSEINGTLTNMGSTGYSSSNNGVIVFDGTNDRVIHNSLDLGIVCSWGIWIKYSRLTGSPVPLGAGIPNYYSLFWNNSSKQFVVYYGGTGLAQLSYPTGLSLDTWYHIFLTRNGLTISVYLNGIFIGNMTGGSSTLSTIFCVIGDERITGGYPFNGNISNVSVYNRVLSSSEVLQNYNTTKSRFGL